MDRHVGGGVTRRAGGLAGYRWVRAGVQGRRACVAAASDLLDGRTGRLNASEAGVTRVRTVLEGSRGFTLGGGRVSLMPSVEVELRRDGGDAETGAGMDVGGGLAFADAVTGLSPDVRVRTLVVHQADGFSERGMSLSLRWGPTSSSPLGLTAEVAPSWGGQTQGGAEALCSNQMAHGMGSHQMYGSGDRADAEVGYRLPAGARSRGDVTRRVNDLALRPGLPRGLRPWGAGAGEGGLRAGSRRAAARECDGGWGQQVRRPSLPGLPGAWLLVEPARRARVRMPSFEYLADGYHVDDAGNLIACTYVAAHDPAERLPIGVLQKPRRAAASATASQLDGEACRRRGGGQRRAPPRRCGATGGRSSTRAATACRSTPTSATVAGWRRARGRTPFATARRTGCGRRLRPKF